MFLRITILGRAEVGLKPGSVWLQTWPPTPWPNMLLSYIITIPFRVDSKEKRGMLARKYRQGCLCVALFGEGVLLTSTYMQRKKEVSSTLGLDSHPALRAYTQDRAVPWLTACHITGHWNTLLVSLPASSPTPSIWWNTAQASSTKTPLHQAWSPARGGPSILPWTESCARFTVWTSRLRAWKTMGNTVSTGPLVFCADVSSLVLCFHNFYCARVLRQHW